MAHIYVRETRRSRSITDITKPKHIREYMAWGDDDVDAIEDAVLNGVGAKPGSAQAPTIINGLKLTDYEQAPSEDDESVFDITCQYRDTTQTFPPPTLGVEVVSFRLNSQTSHETHSLQTINSYAPAGETAPNHHNAVGVTADKLKGVDKLVPVLAYSVKKTILTQDITFGFVTNLVKAAFHYNSVNFRGTVPGETLYMGATSSDITGTMTDITHEFIVSKNITGRSIGDITGINKLGWHYLWAQYEDDDDAIAKAISKRALAAYVEQIYEPADLSNLTGISS